MTTSRTSSAPPEAPHPGWDHVRDHPAWAPYTHLLERLPADGFPGTRALNALLPAGTETRSGRTVRFERPSRIVTGATALGYEAEITATGRISTREDNRHDLCNALVWAAFPRTKAALNARHVAALPDATPGRRGPVRDALTLFDECGGVFTSPRRECLEAVARHDWQALFGIAGEAWPPDLELTIFGHGTLEKLWSPYKAITGRCLLLHAPNGLDDAESLDRAMARLWSGDEPLGAPRDLCPFPFMGVPGWWHDLQDRAFYEDTTVFRPPPSDRSPPPVFSCPS